MCNNLTIINHVTDRKESFGEFCRDFCDVNEPLRNFYVISTGYTQYLAGVVFRAV